MEVMIQGFLYVNYAHILALLAVLHRITVYIVAKYPSEYCRLQSVFVNKDILIMDLLYVISAIILVRHALLINKIVLVVILV